MKWIEDVVNNFWTYVELTDTCWLWTGGKKGEGYGNYPTGADRGLERYAHRFAWQHCMGEIPAGYELDHICGIRNCVNPEHLQLVERGFNGLQGGKNSANKREAKTHCKRGHEFIEGNTYVRPDGSRVCKKCHALREKEYYQERKK